KGLGEFASSAASAAAVCSCAKLAAGGNAVSSRAMDADAKANLNPPLPIIAHLLSPRQANVIAIWRTIVRRSATGSNVPTLEDCRTMADPVGSVRYQDFAGAARNLR